MSRIAFHSGSLLRLVSLWWKGESRGAIAPEFLLVSIVLIILFVGGVEFSRMYSIDTRINSLGSMIGDAVSRESSFNRPKQELPAIFEAAKLKLFPYTVPSLEISLFPVKIPGNKDSQQGSKLPFLYWRSFVYSQTGSLSEASGYQRCNNYTPLKDFNFFPVSSVAIVVQTRYELEPLLVPKEYLHKLLSSLGLSSQREQFSVHTARDGCVDFAQRGCNPSCL